MLNSMLGYSKSIARVLLEYTKSILKAHKLPSAITEKAVYVILSGLHLLHLAGFAPLIGL